MPISGTFWTAKELAEMLNISKQRVFNLAKRYNWGSPSPGIYYSELVEHYLSARSRRIIKGERALDWNDSEDTECPVEGCDGVCLAWPDDVHYKCAHGHSGKIKAKI